MKRLVAVAACLLAVAACEPTTGGGSSGKTPGPDGTVSSQYTNTSPQVNGRTDPNTGVTIYNGNRDELPNLANPIPNTPTLNFYLGRYIDSVNWWRTYRVSPSPSPYRFVSAVEPQPYVQQQMATTGLLTYLFWDNGRIVYDEITPQSRFGGSYTDRTPYHSQSMGKSITAYIVGHAICAGYIDGLDAPLTDWPLMRNTAYGSLRLSDVMDMRAGDSPFVSDETGLRRSGRWYNAHDLSSFASNELAGTEPSGARRYHYNGLATRVMINYAVFKAGSNYQSLLNRVFRDKARIANTVYLDTSVRPSEAARSAANGTHRYTVFATRYDYLRIARAMLEDWNNDTCEGRFLKELYERRRTKEGRSDNPRDGRALGYAGQFHMDFTEMRGRPVFGMLGQGGQSILIDFQNNRIVATNSIHTAYDWYNLVHQVIKTGRLTPPQEG